MINYAVWGNILAIKCAIMTVCQHIIHKSKGKMLGQFFMHDFAMCSTKYTQNDHLKFIFPSS